MFPLRFDPSGWSGPRAKQHPQRSDAFQQLVGDALREKFGVCATVAPTEGLDGSIDAFVETPGNSPALADLPAPQIVECKDHDDARDYLTNASAGWRAVAQKLAAQAAAGWPGRFEPWRRARSYAYCVSAVFQKQAERDKLQNAIRGFFDGLPESQRPPLQEIRVLDWSDLRHIFNDLPRLEDRWRGTGLPLTLGHAEHCATLTRFRRYLLSRHLPFVQPDTDAATRPDAILMRLEACAGAGGVVLKGVGGIGKTRTSLEVGHLADARGWRVLHALPGEPGVTVEDLSAAVLTGNLPTLVIFDYLDQMPRLDLGSLRKRLLPEAELRGIRLALLANLRPSSLRRPNAEREALFTEEILLQPSPRQRADIAELAVDRIAPLAVERLGREGVRELCGERPIVAMFIAEELQRRAENSTLAAAGLTGLRGGDLLGWLRRRLIEDGLVVADRDDFLPPQPAPALIAAAAMLAAAPMAKELIEEAGRVASQAAGADANLERAVLDGLLTLGWLEARGIELAAAHDVVADEVLAQVLWDRASGAFRESVLPCCLAPALHRSRVLGRYATALTRLLGPEASETETEAVLRIQASDWLRSHSKELGQMLASAEVGESAYALGGIVSAPVWAGVCVSEWDELIAPWLKRHGTDVEARHVLYRGLRELPDNAATALLDAAFAWLPQHIDRDTTSYVLAPLLARTDLASDAPRAIDLAMAWLEKFPRVPEAQFVFNALLGRADLGDRAPRAIEMAMAWLEKFHLVAEAQFVFHPLLARADLGDRAPRAIELAMAWLEKFHLGPEAPFVFSPLMARADLGDRAPRAIDLAITWLNTFPLVPEAPFVFEPLLARTDLGDHALHAINLAIAWLQTFPLVMEAMFVLNPLLTRTDLADRAGKAIGIAMTWLEQFQQEPDVEYVLKPLFGFRELTEAQRARCVAIALPHLERLGVTPDASYLLRACLRDRALAAEDARLVVRYALAWLESNPYHDGADFIFNRLLPRPDLSSYDWRAISRLAVAWLRSHHSPHDRDLSLAALLQFPERLKEEDLNWLLAETRQWLTNTPKGARTPAKLLRVLDSFHRLHDPHGERFPTDVLERWQIPPRPAK